MPRYMIRIVVVASCLTGCLAVSSKRQPSTGASVAAAAGGAAIAGAALAGATYTNGGASAEQSATAIATSVIPMAAIYLGEEPDDPTTPGGIYSNLFSGLGNAFGASLMFSAPLIGTALAGDAEDENSAALGAAGGIFVGAIASVFLGNHLPKWGRVVVGALVTGSLTTLGYQLGR